MMNKPLYDQDFLRWTAEQARALHDAAHVGSNLPLDWDNLAEEIESLGRAQRNQLASRIATILEHLMKLQASPAEAPRRGWEATIIRERARIERLLRDSPSLRQEVASMIEEELQDARKVVKREMADHGEAAAALLDGLRYNEDQVLGEWLPE